MATHHEEKKKSKSKPGEKIRREGIERKYASSDMQGHYDMDGVSYQNGHVYVASYWPLDNDDTKAS